MLFGIFYEIALWILALTAIPKMLYQRIVYGKYRNSLSKRFGFGFPDIKHAGRPLIWIHAVSVGETKAVAALAKKLKNGQDNPIIVVSSASETGHAEAQRSMPFADHFVYLPFDLYAIINPIIKRAKPSLVILVESDFWFNFLKSSKAQGAKIVVVNGKVSERSMERFQKFSFFTNQLFGLVDLMCVQNQIYFDRFRKMNVPAEKMLITGNMKFDESYPKLTESELSAWRKQLGITPEDFILVAGSTHNPEEKLLIETLQKLWETFPNLKTFIVPRHPERFQEVAALLSKEKISYIRFSELNSSTGREKVVLMDAMGQLRKCYQLADLALVGGSYTDKVGGHNIIEPCWYGVPVVFGPHMHSQPELVDLVGRYQAGLQITSGELPGTLLQLLQSKQQRSKLGAGGEKLVSEMKGATDRTLQAIHKTQNINF